MDLTLFQFDYDLTFAVFFMNADKTIYGRYGSRSSVKEATRDISVAGLAAAMSAALQVHEGYPGNGADLAGKQAVQVEYKTPDEYPSLRGKFKESLDYEGAVTKSCMHCHQVRDAKRQLYRDAGKPIPDPLMFPNPLPTVVGLEFDPAKRATVARVAPGSAAADAGFLPGDEVMTLNGQPIISLADTQWVLHNAESTDTIRAVVRRGEDHLTLDLALKDGWRRQTDISWRVSSWELRRTGTGGMLFESATDPRRREAGIEKGALALVVKHAGQYGDHGAAARAGFKKGDLVVSFDGKEHEMSPSQLLAYAAQNTKAGEMIQVDIIREGRRLTLALPMQK